MRLIRFGPVTDEKPGTADGDGRRRDLSSHFHDWDSDFFAGDGVSSII